MARTPKPDAKLAALKENGTTNPHAHAVLDPAFTESDFFDARDLVQVRYEMLRRVRTEGQSIAGTTSRFGVSRPTFYKAQTDFARAGLVGLPARLRARRSSDFRLLQARGRYPAFSAEVASMCASSSTMSALARNLIS